MTRAKEVFEKVQLPKEEQQKIGENDFYRLETKLALSLYLQTKGIDYSKYIQESGSEEDN